MTEQAESVVAETETSVETNVEPSVNAESSEADVEAISKEEATVSDVVEEVTAPQVEASQVETSQVETSQADDVQAEDTPTDDQATDSVAETPVAEETAAVTVAEASAVEASTATAEDNASAAEDSSDADASEDDGDDDSRVVKLLSVGQKVPGKVKRITDFGAFVDIGVGRDGLIHISELSVRRVGKVTDMLEENQDIEVWIKKLDRDRNRISLTLIEPGTKTIRELEKGELVSGTVTRILPYGAFIDIGIGRDALLHIREMSEGYVARPEDVVAVGDELEARIIELSRRRQRVDLSIKGLRPEPEVEEAPEPEAEAAAPEAEEETVVDDFADVEVLSPMELAFKRAMEAEGIEIKGSNKKKRKRGRQNRSIQDEIIARTLDVVSDS